MNTQNNSDCYVKVMIIGDVVGKTNIISRFCDNKFDPSSWRTIGMDFLKKTVEVEGKALKMQIYDTSSQERFKKVTLPFYKEAMGIILVYSIEEPESFRNIDKWMKEVKEHASENVSMILIGNKCDITDRAVSYEDGKKLADKYNIPFYETSAKSGININEIFMTIAKDIKNKILEENLISLSDIKNNANNLGDSGEINQD